VDHGDVEADAVEDQRDGPGGEPEPDEELIHHALVLEEDHPRGAPHQQRGPEGDEDQHEQQVRAGGRGAGHGDGQREPEQHAEHGDHEADAERAAEEAQEDGGLPGRELDPAARRVAEVQRGQKVEGREPVPLAPYRLPVHRLAPAGIEREELLAHAPGPRGVHPAAGAGDEPAEAGNVVIEPAAQKRERGRAVERGEVLRHRAKRGLVRQAVAGPCGEGVRCSGQPARHLEVVDAAIEEQAEGRDEEEGDETAPTAPPGRAW
jgi:hypothetical protein